MQNLCLITIILVVVAVTVPVTFAADNCTALTVQGDCCAKKDTAGTTNLCQFIKCNETDPGACYLLSEQQKCGDTNANNSCPAAPAGTTTPQSGPSQPNSTAAPTTTTTPPDSCNGKNKTVCCAKDSNCQYVTCSGDSSSSGCYASNKTLTDICTNGTNECTAATTTTVNPTTAPTKPDSTTNNGTTTQAPPTCDSKNQTDCCAAKATCQFVNCTDLTDATKVHTGCHSKDEDLTKYCVNNTWTDLCATAPGSTQAPSSSSTASPTGGAPQPSKGGDKGKRQGFDAASFIGGIVLCAGIVAIIFFGLKFYKARTERNYHTLH